MKKALKITAKVILILILIFVTFILGLFIFHRISIENEKDIISEPIGSLIEVNGHKMCVYSEGCGDKTLVFHSGFGTPSPILDFRSLYSVLSDDYRIAVVEKFGYGFSDDVDEERSIDIMLSETRSALSGAGIEGSYVLCPHSFSGAEALYWAQTYPDEVEAIISLDAIVPGIYEITPVDAGGEKFFKVLTDMGLLRLLPDNDISPAVACGTLTDKEKEIYMALAHGKFRTEAMMNEVEASTQNLKIVENGEVPDIPMLFFISDMGVADEETENKLRQLPRDYTSGKATYIDLECGHSVHNFAYEEIAEEITAFLNDKLAP